MAARLDTVLEELHTLREQQARQQAQIDLLRDALTSALSSRLAPQAGGSETHEPAEKTPAAAQADAPAQAEARVSPEVAPESKPEAAAAQHSPEQASVNTNSLPPLTAGTDKATTGTGDRDRPGLAAAVEPSLRYKGLTITPMGFFAMEGVWRQRALNADLNTPFNLTPFPGSNQGHISEFNFSSRQSRLGMLFSGDAGPYRLSGYVEADFLSAGVTSNANLSNSYTLRQRQIWGRVDLPSGFALTGGQMWSLVTQNTHSTDGRTEKLTNTIDPAYIVGYTWVRQPALRLQRRFGPMEGRSVTVAMSLENAQTQLGLTANAPSNFIFGGLGQGGGLYNAFNGIYANNVAPDLITKTVLDNGRFHGELGGLVRFFRDVYSPLAPGSATAIADRSVMIKDTQVGGGLFGSARMTSHYLDLGFSAMGGEGVGRYSSGQLGDVTVRPDGRLATIQNYHGLLSVETHPTRRLDVYAYWGAEYNQRTTFMGPTGLLTGYGVRTADDSGCFALTIGSPAGNGASGSPATVGSCASPTRALAETMVGYTYRLVDSPRYGRLQYQFTWSYLTRSTWSGVLDTATGRTGEGRATNNLIYGGMRYYIP